MDVEGQTEQSCECTIKQDAVQRSRVSDQILPISDKNSFKLGPSRRLPVFVKFVKVLIKPAEIFVKLFHFLKQFWLNYFLVVLDQFLVGKLSIA